MIVFSASFQPLQDWMSTGGQGQLGTIDGSVSAIDTGNNQPNPSLSSPNPQTPSSIPDILISSMPI